jgi:hypothetical protein
VKRLALTGVLACLVANMFACSRAQRREDADTKHAIEGAENDVANAEQPRDSHQRVFMQGQLMVSPLRLPTNENARMRIFVYLMIPEGATIEGTELRALRYPEGTVANRVEMWSPEGASMDAVPDATWEALDVRGLRIRDGKVEHYVFRPKAHASFGAMLGVRWLRDLPGAEAQSGELLGALARAGAIGSAKTVEERLALSRRIASLNDCKGCHEPGRPESAGTVHRSTDASGFVQIASVFRDQEPLETYRPRDHNRADSFARVTCGEGIPLASGTACADGSVPHVTYDLERALADAAPHAVQVCEARRYLAAHMRQPLRGALSDRLAPCAQR